MIEKIKKTITEEKEITVSVKCDICGKSFRVNHSEEIFEVQEFTHIRLACGYGSIFGDGDTVELDICQNCLKEKLGEYIRITGEY